jgi:hypothetical protein
VCQIKEKARVLLGSEHRASLHGRGRGSASTYRRRPEPQRVPNRTNPVICRGWPSVGRLEPDGARHWKFSVLALLLGFWPWDSGFPVKARTRKRQGPEVFFFPAAGTVAFAIFPSFVSNRPLSSSHWRRLATAILPGVFVFCHKLSMSDQNGMIRDI